jgi:hypothetical protein
MGHSITNATSEWSVPPIPRSKYSLTPQVSATTRPNTHPRCLQPGIWTGPQRSDRKTGLTCRLEGFPISESPQREGTRFRSNPYSAESSATSSKSSSLFGDRDEMVGGDAHTFGPHFLSTQPDGAHVTSSARTDPPRWIRTVVYVYPSTHGRSEC